MRCHLVSVGVASRLVPTLRQTLNRLPVNPLCVATFKFAQFSLQCLEVTRSLSQPLRVDAVLCVSDYVCICRPSQSGLSAKPKQCRRHRRMQWRSASRNLQRLNTRTWSSSLHIGRLMPPWIGLLRLVHYFPLSYELTMLLQTALACFLANWSYCCYTIDWRDTCVCPSIGLWQCVCGTHCSLSVRGIESCTVMFLRGCFLYTSSDTCCRMYRLATNGEKSDRKQKRTSVWSFLFSC